MANIQSLKKAIFWGNCWEHYQRFSTETTWNGQAIIHLSFAVVEAIPFIGQVVSLAEMFFRGCPKSLIRLSSFILRDDNEAISIGFNR